MTPAGLAQLKLDEGRTLSAIPDVDSALAIACRKAGLAAVNFKALPGWAAIDGRPWTIGTGCTGDGIGPDTVWTDAEAEAQLLARVAGVEAQLAHDLAWWPHVDPVRQDVLVNIAFNVGVRGLEKWPATLGHFAAGDYVQAANDLLNEGPWDRQVGSRAHRLSKVTQSGFWPASA